MPACGRHQPPVITASGISKRCGPMPMRKRSASLRTSGRAAPSAAVSPKAVGAHP